MATDMEAKKAFYEKLIKEYLENDNCYDFTKFANRGSMSESIKLKNALAFAKEHLSKDLYEDFLYKSMPFEEVKDRTKDEIEEYKNKVKEVAVGVNYFRAGIIEITNDLNISLNQFVYMVRQLRFIYKELGATVHTACLNFVNENCSYNIERELSMRYCSISEADEKKIFDIIKSFNLKVNNCTYRDAYRYAVQYGHIRKTGTR